VTKLAEALDLNRVLVDCSLNGKKRTLDMLSKLLADNVDAVSHRAILASFIERENLGNTAIGHGVALPHARLKDLNQPVAAFLRLYEAIDYDCDEEAGRVDLLFGLIVPEGHHQEHLDLLASVAERMSSETFRNAIRSAADAEVVYQLLISD